MAKPSRPPLTRERIIDAAVATADESGIEAVSMRRLGQRLGVEAMSLYNHVQDKDQILDLMLDRVFGQMDLPDVGADWKSGLIATAETAKDALVRHPWATLLMGSRAVRSTGLLVMMEQVVSVLTAAGFEPAEAHHGWHTLSAYVMGYAAQEATSSWEENPTRAATFEIEHAPEFPSLVNLLPHLRECDHDQVFRLGLETIVAGLAAQMHAPST